ncbi:MAG: carboxylating nicotinate-nucleotide diphosphorylase [Planctomycetota bacterium]
MPRILPESWNECTLPELAERFLATDLPTRLFELARDEDLGPDRRDLTAETVADARGDEVIEAFVTARADAVLAGSAFTSALLDVFGLDVQATVLVEDGQRVSEGDRALVLRGTRGDVVRVERPVLNLIGRLSGVATAAASFTEHLPADSVCRIFDTRKTTPGLRVLEKYAVRCGGAMCHRLGLHDAVLIKDNHIAGLEGEQLAQVVTAAAERGRAAGASFIEVEVDTLDQLDSLLTLPEGAIDVVLLDNMTNEQMRDAAVRRDQRSPSLLLEASGGITRERVSSIAVTGVERISIGAITHSAINADFGLDIES